MVILEQLVVKLSEPYILEHPQYCLNIRSTHFNIDLLNLFPLIQKLWMKKIGNVPDLEIVEGKLKSVSFESPYIRHDYLTNGMRCPRSKVNGHPTYNEESANVVITQSTGGVLKTPRKNLETLEESMNSCCQTFIEELRQVIVCKCGPSVYHSECGLNANLHKNCGMGKDYQTINQLLTDLVKEIVNFITTTESYLSNTNDPLFITRIWLATMLVEAKELLIDKKPLESTASSPN